MVGRPDSRVEWQVNALDRARVCHRVGRLEPGLGSVLPGHQYRGPMVSPGEGMAHQLLGITSSDPRLENLRSVSVLLKIDNTTAVVYINQGGGTVSKELVSLTRDLWMWYLKRNIHIQAQYLPGVMNCIADSESRSMRDHSDWKLDQATFQKIDRRYGPLEVDLFASRLTYQCRRYFSWRPDPLAEATDAFLQDWTTVRGFANPPWILVSRVLTKIQHPGHT